MAAADSLSGTHPTHQRSGFLSSRLQPCFRLRTKTIFFGPWDPLNILRSRVPQAAWHSLGKSRLRKRGDRIISTIQEKLHFSATETDTPTAVLLRQNFPQLQKHKSPTLFLLILAYAAATWVPEPGLWAREIRFADDGGKFGDWLSQVRPANILLALLLFSSGLSSSWIAMQQTLRTRSKIIWLAGATWALPLVSALIANFILWLVGAPGEVLLGVWIIACMPVANSSVGWTNIMRGNVPLSLALLILSTSLSPFASPPLIHLGTSLSGIEPSGNASVATSAVGMAAFFALWVLLPVGLGAWGGGRLSKPAAERVLPIARRTSLVMLLLLNYLNGAACLPSLLEQPTTLAWPIASAVALLIAGMLLYRITTQYTRKAPSETPQTTVSGLNDTLLLGVTMRNTGVALVYTTASLPAHEWISLTIIAYTIIQHLFVSVIVRDHSAEELNSNAPVQDDVCRIRPADNSH